MDPLISVIVPVYNVEAYLPRCLRAISEQTYRNLEIILVDDGSTDASGAICEDYASADGRARVIHQKNSGLWAARNTGQEAAEGDFLFFPDADDYFNRGMIRFLYDAISSGKGYDLAICRMKKTAKGDEDVSSPSGVKSREIDRDELYRDLFSKVFENPFSVFMWNKLFRRSAIDRIRSGHYARTEDMDFMLQLFPTIEKAVLIENPLYYWVQRAKSLTHTSDSLSIDQECVTRICYRRFMDLPRGAEMYSHYLLERLYTRLLFWRNQSWDSHEREDVFSECDLMIKNTRKAFWRCSEIPFLKRVVCLLLAANPRMARILIKLTGNK